MNYSFKYFTRLNSTRFPILYSTEKWIFPLFYFLLLFSACQPASDDDSMPVGDLLQLAAARVGTVSILGSNPAAVPVDQPIVLTFNTPLQTENLDDQIELKDENQQAIPLEYSLLDQDKTISAAFQGSLLPGKDYTLSIGNALKGQNGATFQGITLSFTTLNPPLLIETLLVDGIAATPNSRIIDVDYKPSILVRFSDRVAVDKVAPGIYLLGLTGNLPMNITQVGDSSLLLQVVDSLESLIKYDLVFSATISDLLDRPFSNYNYRLYTLIDETPKFPIISDEELLDLVQEQTFNYFWDFGHPSSGLARERNTSGDLVTSGGSGFGIMAIIVGMHRGFISRQEGVERLEKIVHFLEDADRFHGAWSHWLNGITGTVIPFSERDNGGDLIETSFLVQGLLTARQYLNPNDTQEAAIIAKINELWQAVEWNWYTKNGEEVLYWHWSPNFEWAMNLPIRGYNEGLIAYVLAAASPDYSIDEAVYHNGWARNGAMANGNTYYNYTLPLGSALGGPLFFAHYSFLGLDPRNLSDQYANYWEQNVHHSLINYSYCADNPLNYVGYSEKCWGLTASDNHEGYSAHSPTNDKGVITPTAALSSLPYTPDQSMEAMKYFYYVLGHKTWGEYGFYDAFNLTEGWFANSYLAIDQGPIVVMMENYRSGLLWDLFMSCEEVQSGLDKLGFSY
ncbi:MAG TPA: glucoamylase family protein [Saprospiraceae bacterium]|nr:glucoamylase family protein [Saprospiraceae bacterium]HMQ83383.1 glucoamylase family protein [Saprospiraceae bacterium]